MRPLPTYAQVEAIIEYDPATGLFHWKVHQGGARKAGWFEGADEHGYRAISVCGRLQRAHRIAWLLVTGEWPTLPIDHIDGNRANNRWSNLRQVPHVLNCHNVRRASKNSGTGVLGVSLGPSKSSPYLARIRVDGRRIHIGSFATINEAREAYLKAKRELHPGYVEMVNGDNRRAA